MKPLALVLALLAMTPVAQAATPGQERLIAQAQTVGNFYTGDCDQEALGRELNMAEGQTADGAFLIGNQTVVICEDQIKPDTEDYWLILKHEMVHMAQYCKAPAMTETLTEDIDALKKELGADSVEKIDAMYVEGVEQEYEAYLHQYKTADEVADMVQTWCF